MGRIVKPSRTLRSELKRLDEQQRRIGNSSAFAGTGFHPTATNGIESDNFDGDLNAGDPGTKGWSMDADQAAFGELILRPGSIGNDSLTNPLVPFRVADDASAFNATTAWSTPLSVAVTVPAGFTKLLITNYVVSVTMTNSTAGIDYLYSSATVSGASLGGFVLGSPDVPAGASGVAHDFRTGLLVDLVPGATVTFTGDVSTAFGSWTGGTGVGQLTASGLWLR